MSVVRGSVVYELIKQAIHSALLLFLLFFTVFMTGDVWFMIWHACSAGMIIIYLLPAFILSMRNRESGYERGWVEVMYITYQVLWSWGKAALPDPKPLTN